MIESYLGQKSMFLWKAFVNSCEENLSPVRIPLTCTGGKYWTCSHVFSACLPTHTHAHAQWSRCTCRMGNHTAHSAFSCTPCPPHIGDTSNQKCQHFVDICSPTAWVFSVPRYLLSCSSFPPVRQTYTHTDWTACMIHCCILNWTNHLYECLF